MENICQYTCLPMSELGEKLGIIATRLERIIAAQEEILELYRGLASNLHPAELERRERSVLEEYLREVERSQEKLERRLTIRWLSITSLFGFIVYIIQSFTR